MRIMTTREKYEKLAPFLAVTHHGLPGTLSARQHMPAPQFPRSVATARGAVTLVWAPGRGRRPTLLEFCDAYGFEVPS